ncbi:MAG: asparagine synthase (glutamine-hydrolyzing) [Planctomycetes bacterium]|nr:asparagine synthase (glutamine-hydrolyzing) [Planctomycetota bacterium]
MCGIAGAVSLRGQPLDIERLQPMVDVIAHRGPDDAGYLVGAPGEVAPVLMTDTQFRHRRPAMPAIDDGDGRAALSARPWSIFLGHRRLSIIDLTETGHQPMPAHDDSTWIVYNGETYNFRELRAELETDGIRFRGSSDTEVIAAAYERWGIRCVDRLNGMFAFALWDRRRQRLHLVRDRYGIKPLYYTVDDGTLLFGSEIKSLLEYRRGSPPVDLLALNEYFSFQNVLSDRTLFEGVHLLPPGHVLTVDLAGGGVTKERYWDFDFSRESDVPREQIEEQLAEAIGRAVERQCVSDVPIGCYLSGGMDSGTVTALAVGNLGRLCTFTGGFDLSEATEREMSFDERAQAEKMATLFQTEHYEFVMHSGDLAAVMDELIWHLEDLRVGQCYPNYYIARLASRFVKVVMGGVGGDELFGGYPWRYAAAIGPTAADYIEHYYRYWKRLVSNADKPSLFSGDVVAELRDLRDDGAVPFQDHTLSVFKRVFRNEPEVDGLGDLVRHSLYFECKTFLHGLLVVQDKLGMAHGLEERVPLLDNDLVDLAMTIPVTMKVAGIDHLERLDENLLWKKEEYRRRMHTGKNILRSTMSRILPPDVGEARKQGFSAPDETWFRGRAERYVRDTLLDPASPLGEYLDLAFVENVLDEHQSGRRNRRLLIWSFLSFEKWLAHFQ